MLSNLNLFEGQACFMWTLCAARLYFCSIEFCCFSMQGVSTVYCVAGVFMVQQVLLAVMLCNGRGRVSWPIYEEKSLSHTWHRYCRASGKSI